MKKFYIVLGALIIVVVCSLFFINNMKPNTSDPKKMFEKEFDFPLTNSSEIVNYAHYKDEEIVCAKILFDESDLYYYLTNFSKYYNNMGSEINREDLVLDYSDANPWWDLNRDGDDVIFAYRAFRSGNVVKTRNIYTYIVDKMNGGYILYTVY